MMNWFLLIPMLGVVLASERYINDNKSPVVIKKDYKETKKHGYEYNYIQQFNYQGKYGGDCGSDGLYYMDDYSFVFCTHQFAYVQPCPSGTMNSGYEKFQLGSNYHYRDFCDINLVDQGYGAVQQQPHHQHNPQYAVKAPLYEEPKKQKQEVTYRKQYLYHGKYGGQCENDGFYYMDANSFVMCSNGYSFVQPCAPGTRNSGYVKFAQGETYYYRDFCDINLVDEGYGVQQGYLGHQVHKPHPSSSQRKPVHRRPEDEYERMDNQLRHEEKYETMDKAIHDEKYDQMDNKARRDEKYERSNKGRHEDNYERMNKGRREEKYERMDKERHEDNYERTVDKHGYENETY